MATQRRQEFKAYAESVGIDWKDVTALKAELRAENQAWVNQIKALRARCRELGIKRHQAAQIGGDNDLDSFQDFDTIARTIAHEFPIVREENAAEQLYELLAKPVEEYELSAEQCFEQAIERLELLQLSGKYRRQPEIVDDSVPF